MFLIRLYCAALLCLVGPGIAGAALMLSFSHVHATWEATDIVVVSENGKLDGEVVVLESWLGSLQRGERIHLPELCKFAAEGERRIASEFLVNPLREKPKYVTGERMVVFLRGTGTCRQVAPLEPPGKTMLQAGQLLALRQMTFEPAYHRDIQISTAWIEEGQVYAFTQVSNPGPLVLVRQAGWQWSLTEDRLRFEVMKVLDLKGRLEHALLCSDPARRAEALVPFTKDKTLWDVRERAFRGLTECGPAAVPVLRKMLEDPEQDHIRINQMLAKQGG